MGGKLGLEPVHNLAFDIRESSCHSEKESGKRLRCPPQMGKSAREECVETVG